MSLPDSKLQVVNPVAQDVASKGRRRKGLGIAREDDVQHELAEPSIELVPVVAHA